MILGVDMNKNILKYYQNKYYNLNKNGQSSDFEKDYDRFKSHFKVENIDTLTIEQYRDFCSAINNIKSKIGSKKLLPKQFGVYFENKTGFNTKFGNTFENAFATVKEDIKNLINYAQQENINTKIKSRFNADFVNIILSIYNKKFLPIDHKDIDYFLMIFGEIENNKSYFEKQNKLISFRSEINDNWDNFDFAKFVYYVKNTNEVAQIEDEADRQNNINAIYFIAHNEEREYQDKPRYNNNQNHIFKFETNKDWYSSKPKEINKNGHTYYERNKKVTASVLENARECELCHTPICANWCIDSLNNICSRCHPTFERKKDHSLLYFEAHHLIPMKAAGKVFKEHIVNIDIPENIVPLCSNCHNLIHYGVKYQSLVIELFKKRQADLASIGLKISQQELLDMYN